MQIAGCVGVKNQERVIRRSLVPCHVNPINRSCGSLPGKKRRRVHTRISARLKLLRSVSCAVAQKTRDQEYTGRAGPLAGWKRAVPGGSHPRGEIARRCRAFSGYPGALGRRSAAPANCLPHCHGRTAYPILLQIIKRTTRRWIWFSDTISGHDIRIRLDYLILETRADTRVQRRNAAIEHARAIQPLTSIELRK